MGRASSAIVAASVWAVIALALCGMFAPTVFSVELPRVGINVANYNYAGTALPFFDVAHMSDRWFAISANDGWSKLPDRSIEINSLGYPVSLKSDEFARAIIYTQNGGRYPTGQYVLTWSGHGKVKLGQSQQVSIVSESPGRIVYNVSSVSANGLWLDVTQTDAGDPVTNIGLHAPLGDGDGAIASVYKADLENYGVIRNLGWNRTNNQSISKWGDRTTLYDMFWGNERGVPYEAQIQLSNETKNDLWLTVPHLADDDYVRNLAALVSQRLSPQLRVWVEYSNEVWNQQFQQSAYARDVLMARYGVQNAQQAYGRRAAEIFSLFKTELNDERRLVRVIAGQAGNPWVLDESLKGATADGSVEADVAAIAPYFGLDIDALYARHLAGTVNLGDVFAELRAGIDISMTNVVANRAKAELRGLRLVAYEGGQHLVARPGEQHNNTAFVELLRTINRDSRMGELYTYYLDRWDAAGGKTMVLLSNTEAPSKWGNWGLKEHYLDDDAPKFRAVQSYLERLKHDAADFNKDGVIDLADYQTWRQSVGSPNLEADANGDGAVDGADYVAWRHYYELDQQIGGTSAANDAQFASTNLPEPSTIYFTVAGLFLYSLPVMDRRHRANDGVLGWIESELQRQTEPLSLRYQQYHSVSGAIR